MSTATMPAYGEPIFNRSNNRGVIMETPKRLKPDELSEVIEKVKALRTVTKTTGVYTSRSIGEILKPLHVEDLILVGKALQLKPREMPRTNQ